MVAPTQAGEHSLAVGRLGHIHGVLPEFVVCEAPLGSVGWGAGQALWRRGGPQDGQRPVVKRQVAADAVVVAPADLGEHSLAIGILGHIHGILPEFVVCEAPLRCARLNLGILSRHRPTGNRRKPEKQGPSHQ